MNKHVVKAMILACGILGFASNASATVLTFDDVTTNTGLTPIADGYGGLNWDNFGVIHQSHAPGSGYDNGIVSGEYMAYNLNANIGTVDNSAFDFNGAYLVGAWNDGLNVNVQGWSGSTLLYDTTVVVDTTDSTWFDFNYVGIDRLVFNSYGGTPHPDLTGAGEHFAMDNFTFNETASVPAPATLALFGLGLVGLSFSGRRKSRT
ncbi:MAG: PEP-CTERM sorting domain-containing protein [Gammaproteobacteria bacterium]